MSSETLPAPVSPGALGSVRRVKLRALARRSIDTADRASEILPKIVEEIERRLPDMDGKTLIGAGSLLERLTQHRALVAKQAKLGKHLAGQGTQNAQTIVNVQIRGDLPLAERLKLIQAEVAGIARIEPVVIETVLEAPAARPGVETDSGLTQPPENAATPPTDVPDDLAALWARATPE